MLKSTEEQQNALAMRCFVEHFAEGLSRVKRAKTVDERAAYGESRSLAFGKSVKSHRQQELVARLVGIKRKRISEGIKRREKILQGDKGDWLVTKQKPRRDRITEEDRRKIYDFWTKIANRPTGSRKDVVRKRLEKGKYMLSTQSMC